MIMRMFLAILGLTVVFGGVFGWKAWEGHRAAMAAQAGGPPVETVTAREARAETWHPRIRAVGTLTAVRGVEVASETAGKIVEIPFRSGAVVESGEILFRLADAEDRAQVRELEAEARLAEIERDRQRRLRVQGVNSQADVDTAESRLDQVQARAEAARARLEKKTVRAPFDGRTGIIRTDLGEFVEAGHHLVTLQTLDPIYLDFSVPQQRLDDISVGQEVDLSVDTVPGITFSGVVEAISPRIDRHTRNVPIRARVDNDGERLRPGMFVSAAIRLDERENVITVAQTAISFSPYGETVFVVREMSDDDGETYKVVEQRFVRTGERRGDQIAVIDGVEAGETVVTAGQIKLRDGTRVRIDNEVEPDADPDPDVGNV